MTSPPIRRQRAIALVLLVGVLLVGFQTVRLGHDVLWQLDRLSGTTTDNVQWNLVQSEVELTHLQNAVVLAQVGTGSLASVRRRFDLFYSRVLTFRESRSYAQLFRDAGEPDYVREMTEFLNRWVPSIDGPDDTLMDRLALLQSELVSLAPKLRSSVLIAVQVQARQSDERRDAIGQTLAAMVNAALVLFALLAAAVLLLVQMYRRLRQVSDESNKVRGRLSSMVSSSLDAILTVDQNGLIRDFNAAAQELFGYSQAEMVGAQVRRLIKQPQQQSDRAQSLFSLLSQAAQQENIADKRVQLNGQRKSGELFAAELSLSETVDAQEDILVVFLRDISDRVRYENTLKQARDDALAGEYAKSHLLTVMSHEMRTPLNGVLGALDLLEHQDLNPDQMRLVDAIRVSGDLLLHHVNDVLELSRLEAEETELSPVRFDLERMAQGLVDSQQAVARQRGNALVLRSNLAAGQMVLGDSRLIQKAMLNLIGNALKFTRDGEVRVELDRLSGTAEVEIQITDTGPGIAAEDLDRVFEEFVTIDPSFSRSSEGTGLGLAITRKLVEKMEGQIGVESALGEGSLFWMRLPLPVARKAGNDMLPDPNTDVFDDMDSLRILVVEDNDINRMLLAAMLRKQGHMVIEAADGQAGVDCAADQTVDLIFMDISMPGMDGIQAAQKIMAEARNQTTPIVALTAHAGLDDHARFMEAGFVQVVTKPFTIETLGTALARWTGQTVSGFSSHSPASSAGRVPALEQLENTVGMPRLLDLLSEAYESLQSLISDLEVGAEVRADQRHHLHKLVGSVGLLELEGAGDLTRLEQAETQVVSADVATLQRVLADVECVLAELMDQKEADQSG